MLQSINKVKIQIVKDKLSIAKCVYELKELKKDIKTICLKS